jgi:hypothetical protein
LYEKTDTDVRRLNGTIATGCIPANGVECIWFIRTTRPGKLLFFLVADVKNISNHEGKKNISVFFESPGGIIIEVKCFLMENYPRVSSRALSLMRIDMKKILMAPLSSHQMFREVRYAQERHEYIF